MAYLVLNTSNQAVSIGGVTINPEATYSFATLPYLTNDMKALVTITQTPTVGSDLTIGQTSVGATRTAVGAGADQTGATILTSPIILPAGTLGANSHVIIHAIISTTGATAGKTMTAKFGAMTLTASAASGANAATVAATWIVYNNNSTAAQRSIGSTVAGMPFGGATTGAIVTGTVNTANDVSIDLLGTFNSGTAAAETIVLEHIVVRAIV